MTKKILDIWTVQNNKKELRVAMSQIHTDDVIVFTNALINLKINKHLITSLVFDTAVFSEKSDVLILLKKNSPATQEDVFEYLNKSNFNYHTVFFKENDILSKKRPIKEVWFARDPYVVYDACEDTISKNIEKTYLFNKTTQAELQFGYYDKNEKIYGFDRTIYCKGIITLKDKKIFVVNNNIMYIDSKQEEMEKILKNKGFKNLNSCNLEIN